MFKFNRNVPPITNDSRIFAILMSFSGGAIDVYSHIYFHGLVATQTGNIVLLASNISEKECLLTVPKIISIVTFTLGFLICIWIKHSNLSIYWRSYTMLPVIFTSSLVPFLSEQFDLIKIGFLAFGSGLIMLTFTGSKIENNPYTIMMTSGNYRKMLNEWYLYIESKDRSAKIKRNAQNYTIVVIAFLVGAFLLSFVNIFIGKYSIILATVTFFFSFYIEIYHAQNIYSKKNRRKRAS
ncbi:YoaK family protein [Enterococcus sp. AZ126]|uniref:YoaK family protein n=1 Tax=Enterococcus sp. AZ126 TaxID=2774635 RepID=UPI003F281EFA